MHWQLLNSSPTNALTPDEITHLLLVNRGIDPHSHKEFLNPRVEPEKIGLLLGRAELSQAEHLIMDAIKQQRPIIIHGDYDVDGICATAILWETLFHQLKYPLARPFIPHRTDHGYGISQASLASVGETSRHLSTQPPLLVTVDCGISSGEDLKTFREQGATIIVTDHHQRPPQLPQVDAVLHTTELSGTGIAWILSRQLLAEQTSGMELFYDLVALATISDLVPLLDHNRGLVSCGLKQLAQTSRPGLQELYKRAGLTQPTLSPYHVSWLIAPRLNAPGRLSHALNSLKLLVTRNPRQAQKLADFLEQENQRRQRLTKIALQQADGLVGTTNQSILILSHPQWHEGIIGLIAAKIQEKYSLPTIVIAEKEGVSKGSGRSVKGFDLVNFLRQMQETLINFGGHSLAAGFSIETSKIKQFTQKAQSIASEECVPEDNAQVLKVDLELPLSQATLPLAQILNKLEPHGIGNPKPLFLTRKARLFGAHTVGSDNQHLKMKLGDLSTRSLSGIGFNLGHLNHKLREGSLVDLVYQLTEDYYSGQPELLLKIKDLKPSKETLP